MVMRTPVPYFLSYAHDDREDVNRFLEVLTPVLKTSSRYEFNLWQDTVILPGEKWAEEIAEAVAGCRFGLLCVSPNFLASGFIGREELPTLLAKPMVVPVGLHKISFKGDMELKGLAERQLFRDENGRNFDACGRRTGRRAFALGLFKKIGALLEKYPC